MTPYARASVNRLTVDVSTAAVPGAVLLLEADPATRSAMTQRCREAGLTVRACDSIANVERWPIGEIVVTDFAHLTPWWLEVGATHVVVIADDATEAHAATARGATNWLLRCERESIAALVTLLGLGAPAGAPFHDRHR